ncbi:hypothetical protein GCM10027516_30310 [Niabella aquatica]
MRHEYTNHSFIRAFVAFFVNLSLKYRYMNTPVIFKDESYEIIGACMEVHNNLGIGCNITELYYKYK